MATFAKSYLKVRCVPGNRLVNRAITIASSQDRLAAAAAELVKAAELETNSTSFDMISADLAGVKDTIDSKLNTVNQQLSTLKDEVAANTAEIKQQNKLRSLEWAIANVELGSFQYYDDDGFSGESKILVKNALLSFRKGFGQYIGDGTLTRLSLYGDQGLLEENNKKKEEFRDKLVDQIHHLTGQEPRLHFDGDQYEIYYS